MESREHSEFGNEEMPGILEDDNIIDTGELFEADSEVFNAQLRQHFLTHSRGSSINLSFDLSSSSDSSDESGTGTHDTGDIFREQLRNNPSHLRLYIKEKLRYHFMSPLEKWRYRKVFPWKLCFQITKILFVTIQILLFGVDSTQFYQEQKATSTALKAYLLSEWDPIRDVVFYPPTDGPYAVYTMAELFDSVDTVVQKYAKISEEPIGSFKYNSHNGSIVAPWLCLWYYSSVRIFPFNSTISFNNKEIHRCIAIQPATYENFSIVKYLNETDIRLDIQRLIMVKLGFTLRTVHRRSRSMFDYFVTYLMETDIIYTNIHHDGMIEVNLETRGAVSDLVSVDTHSFELIIRQGLSGFVIVLCLISMFLCFRSVSRCYFLLQKTIDYFKTHMNTRMSFSDRFEFVDLWLCLIILNDILVVSGTVIKMTIDLQMISKTRFMYAAILLGTGLLLVWAGVIRYLGYFRSYNILILTLKRSSGNLVKFLIAAIILFLGYAICGWVVLGPHHMKFKTFSTSMECLYAITNGDDIFATFSLATNEYSSHHIQPMIWWFTRFYLYSFVILFICVVINLLYAVIIDAYEAIKEISDASKVAPRSLIHDFIEQRLEHASSVNYLLDEEMEGQMSTLEAVSCCFPWRQRRSNYVDDNARSANPLITKRETRRDRPTNVSVSSAEQESY